MYLYGNLQKSFCGYFHHYYFAQYFKLLTYDKMILCFCWHARISSPAYLTLPPQGCLHFQNLISIYFNFLRDFCIYKSWASSDLSIPDISFTLHYEKEQKPQCPISVPKKLNCFLQWVGPCNWKWQPDVYRTHKQFSLRPLVFIIVC